MDNPQLIGLAVLGVLFAVGIVLFGQWANGDEE